MKLNTPKQITFLIAVVLGLLGLIGYLVLLPVISGLSFWLVFVGFALLVAGMLVKGL